MKFKTAIIAVLALASAGGAAAAQQSASPVHEGPSISTPAAGIKFYPSGVKTEKGELFAGPAYGNFQAGRHGTFIGMPHGFVSPVHSHTEDYFGVVIKGVGANQLPGGKIIPLPAGSYWFQKGEEAHVTQCLSKEDCLFLIVQPGKFDYVPVK